MALHTLPFKVGQDVETRSFLKGFRGAWFRCKIIDIGWRNGQLSCALKYYDFPDEKITWEKIYQHNPADGKRKRKGKILMMRPPFPSIYHESKRSDANTILEAVVIVSDAWKVGDLVDWWKDGCYWSGKVTEVLGHKKLMIELPLPPVGEGVEGQIYEASFKDLRSSLDWSLEYGWTVPTPKERENGHPCVRVIKPDNQGDIPSLAAQNVDDGKRDVQEIVGIDQSLTAKHIATAGTNMESDVADSRFVKSCSDSGSSSRIKDALNNTVAGDIPSLAAQTVDDGKRDVQEIVGIDQSLTAKDIATAGTNMESDVADSRFVKNCSDSGSSSRIKDALNNTGGIAPRIDIVDNNRSLKRMKADEGIILNSVSSDTLEATILDLEELVNRVKLMKGMLEIGIPFTGVMRPRWKFLKNHTVPTPK